MKLTTEPWARWGHRRKMSVFMTTCYFTENYELTQLNMTTPPSQLALSNSYF